MNWKSRIVLLVLMTTLSTGCEKQAPLYCPMPVEAPAEVHEWYKQHKPLPPYLKSYLDAVGRQQQAIKDNCGKR